MNTIHSDDALTEDDTFRRLMREPLSSAIHLYEWWIRNSDKLYWNDFEKELKQIHWTWDEFEKEYLCK